MAATAPGPSLLNPARSPVLAREPAGRLVLLICDYHGRLLIISKPRPHLAGEPETAQDLQPVQGEYDPLHDMLHQRYDEIVRDRMTGLNPDLLVFLELGTPFYEDQLEKGPRRYYPVLLRLDSGANVGGITVNQPENARVELLRAEDFLVRCNPRRRLLYQTFYWQFANEGLLRPLQLPH